MPLLCPGARGYGLIQRSCAEHALCPFQVGWWPHHAAPILRSELRSVLPADPSTASSPSSTAALSSTPSASLDDPQRRRMHRHFSGQQIHMRSADGTRPAQPRKALLALKEHSLGIRVRISFEKMYRYAEQVELLMHCHAFHSWPAQGTSLIAKAAQEGTQDVNIVPTMKPSGCPKRSPPFCAPVLMLFERFRLAGGRVHRGMATAPYCNQSCGWCFPSCTNTLPPGNSYTCAQQQARHASQLSSTHLLHHC